MDENKMIDDLVAMLDASMAKGVGHINADVDVNMEGADADALFNTGRGRSNHRNNMMDKDMKTDDIFDLEPL